MRQKNPFDPLDDLWRWLDQLWPLQRWGFWLCCGVVMWGMLMWITKP